MAKMGVRKLQDLIGRTDKLKFAPDPENHKANLLDFSQILKFALDMRPGINIKGGSVSQIFNLEKRLVCFMT
jgi:glutamate synthase (NADPH/NADH)